MATRHFGHLTNALKIVVVGDAEVGKTWLISRARELYATLCDGYSLFKKPFDYALVYSPTTFETYITNVDTGDFGNYQTNIWDTGGCAIFNFVRPLAYIRADVFMLCFDLSNRESFRNVTERWLPELEKYQPGTPVVIVGTKSDLRNDESEGESNDLVSFCEAQNVTEKMGYLYQETSAQTGEHVADAFESAVKLGHTRRKEASESRRSKIISDSFDSTWIPPMRSPPEMKIEASTYVSDFKTVLNDTTNADVLFKFEDGSQSISAHKIVLWLTPSVFRGVLNDKNKIDLNKVGELFEFTELDDLGDLNSCTQVRTCIVLKNWISRETFVQILEFLYTGEAGISKDTKEKKIKELLTASEKLEVRSLVDICNYFLKLAGPKKNCEQKIQNSNQTEKKDAKLTPPPRTVQDMFVNKEATVFSDLTFLVDGILVYAHKAILVARSPVLAALLSENFVEGKSSQYLYTDHCPSLAMIPAENVLILADRLCLSRLVQICEIHIHKELQQFVSQVYVHVANEFLDALAFSKMFNAKQLAEWCLHFIAFNYNLASFQEIGKELHSVVKENKQFFEENCWPPQDYLQVLEKYRQSAKGITAVGEKLHRKTRSCFPPKCRIM